MSRFPLWMLLDTQLRSCLGNTKFPSDIVQLIPFEWCLFLTLSPTSLPFISLGSPTTTTPYVRVRVRASLFSFAMHPALNIHVEDHHYIGDTRNNMYFFMCVKGSKSNTPL